MSSLTFFGPPPSSGLTPDQHDEWMRFAVVEMYVSRGWDSNNQQIADAYELITGRPWQRYPQDHA
jgi:hypothetical protein